MIVKYKHLSLGARFSYEYDPSRIFVKLTEAGQIVEWFKSEVVVCFNKPSIQTINPETKVAIMELSFGKTSHDFPKTAFEEGYEHYYYHPRWSDNPYSKGSDEYEEFQRGYNEADSDDCI